jgi:hypothetical protein
MLASAPGLSCPERRHYFVSFSRHAGETTWIRARLAAALAALFLVALAVSPAVAVTGPTKLFDAAVTPRTALAGQAVLFEISYRNREGSPADRIELVVGGAVHPMPVPTGEQDWKAGVRVSLSVVLPAGEHAVSFAAADTRRFKDEIAAGSITVELPPAPTPTPTPAAGGGTPSTGGGSGRSTPGAGSSPSPSAPASGGAPAKSPRPAVDAGSATPAAPDASGGSAGGAGSTEPPTGPGDEGSPPDPNGAASPVAAGTTEPDSPPRPAAWWRDTIENGEDRAGLPSSRVGLPPAKATPSPDAIPFGQPPNDTEPAWASTIPGWPGNQPLFPSLTSAIITTGGTVTLLMAFGLFGKRRNDGDPPAPDEVLSAAAARGTSPANGALASGLPLVMPTPAPVDTDLFLPRWRRPSLLAARKNDPLRSVVAEPVRLTFETDGTTELIEGHERRRIRYRLVRLLDAPDELRSSEIGVVDEGDEVELLDRTGAYWFVLCPDGSRGWLHKMTLGERVETAAESEAAEAAAAEPAVDDDVLAAYLAARGRN